MVLWMTKTENDGSKWLSRQRIAMPDQEAAFDLAFNNSLHSQEGLRTALGVRLLTGLVLPLASPTVSLSVLATRLCHCDGVYLVEGRAVVRRVPRWVLIGVVVGKGVKTNVLSIGSTCVCFRDRFGSHDSR